MLLEHAGLHSAYKSSSGTKGSSHAATPHQLVPSPSGEAAAAAGSGGRASGGPCCCCCCTAVKGSAPACCCSAAATPPASAPAAVPAPPGMRCPATAALAAAATSPCCAAAAGAKVAPPLASAAGAAAGEAGGGVGEGAREGMRRGRRSACGRSCGSSSGRRYRLISCSEEQRLPAGLEQLEFASHAMDGWMPAPTARSTPAGDGGAAHSTLHASRRWRRSPTRLLLEVAAVLLVHQHQVEEVADRELVEHVGVGGGQVVRAQRQPAAGSRVEGSQVRSQELRDTLAPNAYSTVV